MLDLKKKFLNQLGFFVGTPAILWQLLFLWVPLIFVLYMSFTPGTTLISNNFACLNLTLNNYLELLDFTHLKVILRSLFIASVNTLLCLTIGYPVAYYLALYLKKLKSLALFLLTLPFWINFLVHIYAWFFILERGGLLNQFLIYLGLISEPLTFINSQFATALVMFHVYLPFMIMPIYTVLEKFNKTLIEASLDLGATHWQTFWRVTVPLSFSGIRTGALLVFVMSFGEYAIPILMGGSKTFYVGGLITEYFLIARNMPKGAAFMVLSTLGLGLALLLMLGFNLSDKTKSKSKISGAS
jgi:spermidine/putrescine transport system permease protein